MILGHVNFDNLKMMTRKEMLKGLPYIIHLNQLCEGCLVGKRFRKSCPKESTSRANQPLQEIHGNVCDPIQLCSFYKNLYFLLFINDYSIRTYVDFLKEKSNVFNCFKKFKALVEKENSYSIESPKTNKMVGFFSNEFNEFCEYHCIKRLLTMPRSP